MALDAMAVSSSQQAHDGSIASGFELTYRWRRREIQFSADTVFDDLPLARAGIISGDHLVAVNSMQWVDGHVDCSKEKAGKHNFVRMKTFTVK